MIVSYLLATLQFVLHIPAFPWYFSHPACWHTPSTSYVFPVCTLAHNFLLNWKSYLSSSILYPCCLYSIYSYKPGRTMASFLCKSFPDKDNSNILLLPPQDFLLLYLAFNRNCTLVCIYVCPHLFIDFQFLEDRSFIIFPSILVYLYSSVYSFILNTCENLVKTNGDVFNP